ncbi:unnamed protein product [Bemisia tabaci]|uniref:CRAL-TRIO domain-containing protein n=2 Tax=Bemisia tabaci TaxID=7038 RepID=A0A9P0G1C2_BEMTA|nr:unnamed protein product [Bemisia tabaci]
MASCGNMVVQETEVVCRPNTDPFDLNLEWQMRAEKELNECPETARKNVVQLRQKLKEDLSMNSRVDDVFCMAFLRARKHDVDKAYKLIKSYYEMKRKYPDFYRYCYPSERSYIYDMCFLTLLPGTDKLGRVVTVICVRNTDFSQISLEDMFQVGTSSFEVALMDPKLQIAGGVAIIDMQGMSIYQQAKLVTPSAAWQITNCVQEKIPLRVKAIHIVHQPLYFSALYSIFKPFLKSKLRKRIHLHGSNMESLHKHISPSVLPKEYGGTKGPLNSKPHLNLIKQYEHKLRDWSQFGYDKKIPQ